MRFSYYDRLSAARQLIYRKSDEITLGLPLGVDLGAETMAVSEALSAEDQAGVRRSSQTLIAALLTTYVAPPVRVRVLARRPSHDYGELHGLYEPEDEGTTARITVWMRTAQKRQVVAFKTFLRTLVHEFCHHLDYELFLLPETFHTEGFYKRESDLAKILLAQRLRSTQNYFRCTPRGAAASKTAISKSLLDFL